MYTALQDIKLETVDFKWIQQTTKLSHLKKAIRLIQLDGDYYKQLKDACYDRIGQIDPSQKRIKIDNRMTQEIKSQIQQQLAEWQQEIDKNTQQMQQITVNKQNITNNQQKQQQIDYEQYFDKQAKKTEKNTHKLAENERTKGNEAIRSKDYQQAIRYYTKSIDLDGKMYQAFGNRALAHLKLKDFQKALNDCQQALNINPQYLKAYHRKAKALIGLKNRVQAYKTFQQALKKDPQNSQFLAQLKDLREQMSSQQLTQLEGKSQFKKIAIEEDSDEQEQEQEIKQK